MENRFVNQEQLLQICKDKFNCGDLTFDYISINPKLELEELVEEIYRNYIAKSEDWVIYPICDYLGRRTGKKKLVCPRCFRTYVFLDRQSILPSICPNCGLKMKNSQKIH